MSGAGGVVTLVLLEWTAGWLGAAAWTQSWKVVTRGHFRITAWAALAAAVLAWLAGRAVAVAPGSTVPFLLEPALTALMVAAAIYLTAQYLAGDGAGSVVGALAAAIGLGALALGAQGLSGWPVGLGALELVAGAVLLGGVTNGMMLGHWYLNQPGLKPWALARLTHVALAGVAGSIVLGAVAWTRLSRATTDGAVLGLPGFGMDLGGAFYIVWLVLIAFTGVVVWGARRCIAIRSIQSATGLYYAALLSAGVSEFVVRYLMVNAA
ncbi:MAG: hypothetical protein ABR575_11555 [Actinomycetota bacterium]